MLHKMFTSRGRLFSLTRFIRLGGGHVKHVTRITRYSHANQQFSHVPCSIGFSILTLLGLQKKKSPEDELIDMIRHSIYFMQKEHYIKAEQLLHIALRQAQQVQHELAITYIYDVMANLAMERQELDKAKKLFISVSQRLMSMNGVTEDDLRIVHISLKLARISHLKKDYQVAQLGYDWCMNKLQTYEKNPAEDTQLLLVNAEDWYARLFLDCRQYEQALNLLQNSLKHMKEIASIEKELIVQQLSDIGAVYDLLGRLDDSIRCYQEAIELGKQHNCENELAIVLVNQGRAFLKKKMITEARKSCGQAWKIAQKVKNQDTQSEANQCIKEVNGASI